MELRSAAGSEAACQFGFGAPQVIPEDPKQMIGILGKIVIEQRVAHEDRTKNSR
ncbi:hypothetical protein [Asanoa ishikariensis]|uniref:hypothetical protein n=1 Tax=Asanoa ishikariensis TaxID=137265 RepID=UPI0019515EB1|nr:hypothetical protein [Asanoa ishikariensis]